MKITRNVVIPAPPEEVYDVIDDTANLPQLWPNLSNVRNLKRIENGGQSFEFDYKMAGLRVEGSSIDLVYERPTRMVTRTTGGVTATLSWTFEPLSEGRETDLHLEVEYDVPVPLVGMLAERLVSRINEVDIDNLLNHLRYRFPKRAPGD